MTATSRKPGAIATVSLKHHCKSEMGGECVHTSECSVHGTVCLPRGLEATCDCDEDHVRDESGGGCKTNPIKIGEECTTSKQCAKLEAKCRRRKGSKKKVCSCLKTHYVDSEGACSEIKDRGEIDLKRIFREPTWRELNPGRRRVKADKLMPVDPKHRKIKGGSQETMEPICTVDTVVDGGVNFPEPRFPREYFPLRLTKTGFEMGFFLKGKGEVVLEFNHLGNIMKDNPKVFSVTITDNVMEFTRGNKVFSVPMELSLFMEASHFNTSSFVPFSMFNSVYNSGLDILSSIPILYVHQFKS